ncbi:MAG: RNA methyltransferase [Rhodospirillaceae bacterium]
MAGTDKRQDRGGELEPGGPAVILVEPQLGENIGMAARAMLNCGLSDLRLVQPRDGWPSEPARKAASGADRIIDTARIFDTTGDAIADLNTIYAATARSRDMTKRVLSPRQAAAETRAAYGRDGTQTGILFGKESKGLTNDDVALASAVVQAPLNPAFASLNLAQAVFLMGYEWRLAALEDAGVSDEIAMPKKTRPAEQAKMIMLYEHLERELEACGFLYPPERAPIMVRNLRNALGRANMSEQEVRTFRGVISALTRGPNKGK